MTPYHILIAPVARTHIKMLSAKYQKMIIKLLEALAINPRPPGVKKIEGMTGLYAKDLNHLRIIYKIDEQEIILLLVK